MTGATHVASHSARTSGASFAWVVTVACLLLGLPAQGATAQDTAEERAAARRLFREGVEARDGGRWQEARERFARVYALSDRPAVLVNLAAAQVATGQLVEAAESYRRFIQRAGRRTRARHGAAVREALAALEARFPMVRLAPIEHLRSGDRLTLDGRVISHAALDLEMPVNPGEHRLEVRRAGQVIATETFVAAERARMVIRAEVETRQAPAVETLQDSAEPDPSLGLDTPTEPDWNAPADGGREATEPIAAPTSATSAGPYIALGVGGALLVTGAVFFALMHDANAELDSYCTPTDCDGMFFTESNEAASSSNTYFALWMGAWALSAVPIAIGALWMASGGDDSEPPPVTAACDAHGCSAALRLRL